jgi:hypothetical protein
MRWTKEKDEAVFECLDSLEWVIWEGREWWADGIWLKEPENARNWVSNRLGFSIDKQTFKILLIRYLRGFVEDRQPIFQEEKDIVVLRPKPSYFFPLRYSKRCLREGLWYPVRNEAESGCSLYFMPPRGDLEVLTQEHWPNGVYCIEEWGVGRERNLDPSGTIDDLFEFWSFLACDVKEGWELSLALILPALFGQGRAMFMIVGSDWEAQERLLVRIISLVGLPTTFVSTQSIYERVYCLWKESFICVSMCNSHMASTSQSSRLIKLAMEGTIISVRRPRTTLTVDKFRLDAPVFICSAGIKVHERLASRSLDIHLRGTSLSTRFDYKYHLQPRALMGAFRLFQKAAQVKLTGEFSDYVTNGGCPDVVGIYIPYMDWMEWAYRYACVLGIENKFLDYLKRTDKWNPSYKKG